MATTFEVVIEHKDARYAKQTALAAFGELDRLDAELSRFIENSDVSRISSLAQGESACVGLDTFECLTVAEKLCHQTDGAFDVTLGPVLKCWLAEDGSPRQPSKQQLDLAREHVGMDLLRLDEGDHSVQALKAPVHIDLGGIGKGYAVDRMADVLGEWSITTALIHAGHSSVLALAAPRQMKGWPVELGGIERSTDAPRTLYLKNRALGGSSVRNRQHIVDPRTAEPVVGAVCAWAGASDAATADALSTAFMVMTPDQISRFCTDHPSIGAMVMLKGSAVGSDRVLRCGLWDEGAHGGDH